MDYRQMIGDKEQNTITQLNNQQSKIWTALPGVITGFDPITQTASVLPTITVKRFYNAGIPLPNDINFDGVVYKEGDTHGFDIVGDYMLPQLVDCPVQFLSGGGVTLTFPIAIGDECLIIFACRCIDGWWENGYIKDVNGNPSNQYQYIPPEMRLHDLSDGFVIPGFKSRPNVVPNISIAATQIRTNDGLTYIEFNPTNHNVNIVTMNTGAVNITTPNTTMNANVTINGNLQVNGSITSTGDMVANGISMDNHTHPNVQSGSSNTGKAQG